MNSWQLQYVKSHLSEVVRLCLRQGPQLITVRGDDTAVLISKRDYEDLLGAKPKLTKFMRTSPLAGLELECERDQSPNRDVDLYSKDFKNPGRRPSGEPDERR